MTDAFGQASTSRRAWLKDASAIAVGAVVVDAVAGGGVTLAATPAGAVEAAPRRANRIRQSVSRWCYSGISLAELCVAAKGMGLVGIDLLQRGEWDVAIGHGLTVTMGYAADRRDFLSNGFTNRASHPMLVRELTDAIPEAAHKGVPNLIAMFGNRERRPDVEAITAAVDGLQQVAPVAERHGVTICLELLNSTVDHKDYHGDHTAFGVEVMRGVGSPNVKLLYDIYHMQIMEGDIIRTVREHKAWIGHFHTGGVPGRHELDDTQELNWRGIMTAIADMGYTGYVAHEFVPTRDPLTSLREAVRLCDV